jgi:DNA-binding transcriptional LysR family regulator
LPLQAQTSLYVAAGHPLASRNGCREADLREHRQLRLQTCQAGPADESGQLAWSAPSYLLLLELAQCGFGWAELPHWLAARYGQGLTALALPGWPRQRAMDAVWPRQRPPGPAQAWMLTQLAG